jgi:hypothetical protein
MQVGMRGSVADREVEMERDVVSPSTSSMTRVNMGDVGMGQRGKDLSLALEPGKTVGVGREGIGQQLQRVIAFQPRVPHSPDLTHPVCGDVHQKPAVGRQRILSSCLESSGAVPTDILHFAARVVVTL